MRIVYRAGGIAEAEIIKGMLLCHDIEAHVSGFYLQGGIGEIAPTDLAKVHVTEDDYERAREIMLEYEGNQIEEINPNSELNITQSTRTKRILVTIIIVIAISITSFWVGI
jgi:hypothetical protein|tara:strand:- start:1280 stop:1612 length:333 start_codon:yes stop_codon:yes gene_type:complete